MFLLLVTVTMRFRVKPVVLLTAQKIDTLTKFMSSLQTVETLGDSKFWETLYIRNAIGLGRIETNSRGRCGTESFLFATLFFIAPCVILLSRGGHICFNRHKSVMHRRPFVEEGRFSLLLARGCGIFVNITSLLVYDSVNMQFLYNCCMSSIMTGKLGEKC